MPCCGTPTLTLSTDTGCVGGHVLLHPTLDKARLALQHRRKNSCVASFCYHGRLQGVIVAPVDFWLKRPACFRYARWTRGEACRPHLGHACPRVYLLPTRSWPRLLTPSAGRVTRSAHCVSQRCVAAAPRRLSSTRDRTWSGLSNSYAATRLGTNRLDMGPRRDIELSAGYHVRACLGR